MNAFPWMGTKGSGREGSHRHPQLLQILSPQYQHNNINQQNNLQLPQQQQLLLKTTTTFTLLWQTTRPGKRP
jgi:hypothetical protein